MASKLTQIAQEFSAANMQRNSSEALTWFKKKIRDIRSPSNVAASITRERFRQENRIVLGKLYCFYYDPKGKNTLPYYDVFPMVLVLEQYPDGFLGLNLHYLPFQYRVAFLNKLLKYATLDKNDEIQRLRVTYDILSASKRLREFRPCLKRYLFGQLQSGLFAIQPNEWETAVYLPLQSFVKAGENTVWQESLEQIER
jgi:hypothetical protein